MEIVLVLSRMSIDDTMFRRLDRDRTRQIQDNRVYFLLAHSWTWQTTKAVSLRRSGEKPAPAKAVGRSPGTQARSQLATLVSCFGNALPIPGHTGGSRYPEKRRGTLDSGVRRMTNRRHWIPAPYRIQGKLCAGMRTRPCEHLSGLHAPRVPARKDDTLLHDIECNAGKEGGGNLWFPGGGTGVSPVRLHSPS